MQPGLFRFSSKRFVPLLAVAIWLGASWHTDLHTLEDFAEANEAAFAVSEKSESISAHSHEHSGHKECAICQLGVVAVETPALLMPQQPVIAFDVSINEQPLLRIDVVDWILPLGHAPPARYH
jgi:hypothetical protein